MQFQILALATIFSSAMASPASSSLLAGRQAGLCASGNPLCCDVNVLGVADLNCEVRKYSPRTVTSYHWMLTLNSTNHPNQHYWLQRHLCHRWKDQHVLYPPNRTSYQIPRGILQGELTPRSTVGPSTPLLFPRQLLNQSSSIHFCIVVKHTRCIYGHLYTSNVFIWPCGTNGKGRTIILEHRTCTCIVHYL
jgi:hypothetical protein